MNRIGIDVSNDVFDACRRHGETLQHRQFRNQASGYRKLLQWLAAGSGTARVCLEATGIYHLQLALALDAAEGVELMVLNPKAAQRFAQANMVRAKTDTIDAAGLLVYLERMPFKPWSAPSQQVLQLQALSRRLAQLTQERTRERNRLHAAKRAGRHTAAVCEDLRDHLRDLTQRIEVLTDTARQLIRTDADFNDDLQILCSVPGLADRSATKLLAELGGLPRDLLPKHWVAQAGLDPRPQESGSSRRAPRRISKQGNARIREALFLPALTAIRCNPNINAFYEQLRQRGKAKMQAIVAVMRKLLHAIWGMLKHRQTWNPDKFYKIGEIKT